jgi:Retroviral aspartyl protease
MVANGARMITNSKCSCLKFSLQGHEFIGDFKLLQIQGYDLILGMDWLSQFKPMLVGWNNKWIEFDKQGTKVKLQVREERAVVHMYEDIHIVQEIHEGNDIMVAQI